MSNSIYKKGLAVVLILALMIMTYLGVKLSGKEENIYLDVNEKSIDETTKIKETDNNTVIIIDIDGAINNPGVYEFKDGDRVNDAIIKAGGLKDNAFTKNLNKARILIDGEKIYIPALDENISLTFYDEPEPGKININTASKEIIMTLDGIGEVYAQRIIDYRNSHMFVSIDEVKNIEGIGEKTFEKIKDFITVN